MELKGAALGLNRSGTSGKKIYMRAVIEMAVREGIASKYTSFIAVDTASDEKASGNWVMHTRMLPSQFVHGWPYPYLRGGGPPPTRTRYEPDTLEKILSYQSFNGSFKMEKALVQLMGLDLAKVVKEGRKNGWDDSAWATAALALAYLAVKLRDRPESWDLVAEKIKKLLSKNCAAMQVALTAPALKMVNAA